MFLAGLFTFMRLRKQKQWKSHLVDAEVVFVWSGALGNDRKRRKMNGMAASCTVHLYLLSTLARLIPEANHLEQFRRGSLHASQSLSTCFKIRNDLFGDSSWSRADTWIWCGRIIETPVSAIYALEFQVSSILSCHERKDSLQRLKANGPSSRAQKHSPNRTRDWRMYSRRKTITLDCNHIFRYPESPFLQVFL